MTPTKKASHIPVESTKHSDTRVNIPTEELRNFVKDDEQKPKAPIDNNMNNRKL